jgi:AcrR family transcriptional regulator
VTATEDAHGARARLVAAGLELIDELPYEDITVSVVTERAQVSRSLLFYYFGNKDGLLEAVGAEYKEQEKATWAPNDPSLRCADPYEWLRAETDIFLESMCSRPHAMRTLTWHVGRSEYRHRSMEEMSEFTAERIRIAFGFEQGPLLDAVLHSWGIHCVEFVLRLQEAGSIDREFTRELLVAELATALQHCGVGAPKLTPYRRAKQRLTVGQISS